MTLIDNWRETLRKSLSLWCVYIALAAGAVHAYISQVPHGAIPDALVSQVDSWSLAVAFLAGLAAIPARIKDQGLAK